jgi:hypothetical protein
MDREEHHSGREARRSRPPIAPARAAVSRREAPSAMSGVACQDSRRLAKPTATARPIYQLRLPR